MKIGKSKILRIFSAFCILHSAFLICANAQETQPVPSAPKSVSVPAVKEKKLPNNLTVAIIERGTIPLVTINLVIKSGAETEEKEKAGLANLTAALLTKGTKTLTATQIAEQIEFLGGSINSGANWNNSVVSVNITSDKLEQALAIMSDVVLNPNFDQKEIDLLKTQTLDSLTYNLKQPSFLANYVASAYSYNEHPASGTPVSIGTITRTDITGFHQKNFEPQNTVLIFAGDITASKAESLATQFFGKWKNQTNSQTTTLKNTVSRNQTTKRILVVDLPNSGQAAVNYTKNLQGVPRSKQNLFFPATVLNSLLGGGYSSRLNQEIRIKRGLSYGAGSSFAWRESYSNFGTRTQTKNESAAEVAELVLAEVNKLTDGSITESELTPRKSVLTGDFGRNLETTQGLAAAVADLYSFGLPASELNSYVKNVQTVSDKQIMDFASANLMGGDVVIVGDYAKFRDDLAKRFPNVKVKLIKASELDLSKESLQK